MSDLSAFPITKRWPAQHPDRLQLYSLPTPNGVKVSIMLEEIGLPYEPHLVDIGKNESWTPEFLSLNPNGKIPAIIDPDGPGGKPLGLFESGAILIYLAEKTGKLHARRSRAALRDDPVGDVPDGGDRPDVRPARLLPQIRRQGVRGQASAATATSTKSKRLLGVLETRLDGREWIMGDDYTIADISMLGWVRNLIGFYERARDGRLRRAERMCRPGWSAAWRGRRCSAGWRSRNAASRAVLTKAVTLRLCS